MKMKVFLINLVLPEQCGALENSAVILRRCRGNMKNENIKIRSVHVAVFSFTLVSQKSLCY